MTAAILDDYVLPFNPDSLTWGYKLNINSQDTLGGRVLQVLSVNITTMTFSGVAGNRERLLGVVSKVEAIMARHIDTQRPVKLFIPSRGWSFDVYVSTMPSIGWSVTTVAYPYQLNMEVSEDFGGLSKIIMQDEIKRLAQNIGYNPTFSGPQLPVPDNPTEGSQPEDEARPGTVTMPQLFAPVAPKPPSTNLFPFALMNR